MHRNKPHPYILTISVLLLTSGCDLRDERLTQLAQRNAELQARQNQEMSELNREVAGGTRRLVEADAASTSKLIAMQGDLQRQHEQLEAERRGLALQRSRESWLAPIITSLGAVLLALLPLLICWRLLGQVRNESPESELSGLLIEQLLDPELPQQPLPSPPSASAVLPSPSSSTATPTSDAASV